MSWPEQRARLLASIVDSGPVVESGPADDEDEPECVDVCEDRTHAHFDADAYFEAAFEAYGPHRRFEG